MQHHSLQGCGYLDALQWGPKLRYCAPERVVETFYREVESRLTPFTLYGSGDFHHLTALWLRKLKEPFTLISFDNHPDWDVRPPRWCCGTWMNRALKLPLLKQIQVWGCGSFECWWPTRLFANHAALKAARLHVHAWADRRSAPERKHRQSMELTNWRDRFTAFCEAIRGESIYVTVDIDCLREKEAATNWEHGFFTVDDIAWALRLLHQNAKFLGGDLCGAYSPPRYARWKQNLLANLDHPKLPVPDVAEARTKNLTALKKLWPELTG
jgi:hypothetical protein